MTTARDFDGVKRVLTIPDGNSITKVGDIFKLKASDDTNSLLKVLGNRSRDFRMEMALDSDNYLVGTFPAPNETVYLVLELLPDRGGKLKYGENPNVGTMGDNGGSTGGNN